MECFIETDKKYFPELNWFEKAISYPYEAPKTSFTFKNGKFYEGIHISIKNRIPIISIGSNRSPYQLKNKFGIKENLCATPAKLHNSIIVYAASISAYGSIPATQWPCEGSVTDLNLLWLSQDQLAIMHLTEGLGVAYNYVELDKETVILEDEHYKGPVYGYISTRGGYLFEGNLPFRLKNIESKKNSYYSISEYEALSRLYLSDNSGQISFKNWLKKIISNKKQRLSLVSRMSHKSILPNEVPWKVLDVKIS